MKNRYSGMLSTTFDGYTEKTLIKEHDSKGKEGFLKEVDAILVEIIAEILIANKKNITIDYGGDFAKEVRPHIVAGLEIIERPELMDGANKPRVKMMINEARRER